MDFIRKKKFLIKEFLFNSTFIFITVAIAKCELMTVVLVSVAYKNTLKLKISSKLRVYW